MTANRKPSVISLLPLGSKRVTAGPAYVVPIVKSSLSSKGGTYARRGAVSNEAARTVSRHSTVIFACAVSSSPLSPVHRNSSVPLSLATVKNVMKGFAEIA
jgi:hypothetical protein